MRIDDSSLRRLIRKTIKEQSGNQGDLLPVLPFVDRAYNPITNVLGGMSRDATEPDEEDSLYWLQVILEKIPQGHSGICLTDRSGNVTMYEFGRYEKESSYEESGCGGEPRIQFGAGLWVDAVVKETSLGNFRRELKVYDDGENQVRYFSEDALRQIGSKIEGSGTLYQCLDFDYETGMRFVDDFGIGVCREYTVLGVVGEITAEHS